MKEIFYTQAEAKVRRNELLDASLYTQTRDFEARYTHTSFEDACRYRAALYRAVDAIETWPAEVEWPEIPHYQSVEDYNASLPRGDM